MRISSPAQSYEMDRVLTPSRRKRMQRLTDQLTSGVQGACVLQTLQCNLLSLGVLRVYRISFLTPPPPPPLPPLPSSSGHGSVNTT